MSILRNRNSKKLAFQDAILRFWVIAYQSQNIFWRWNPLTDLWRHFFWYFTFKRTVLRLEEVLLDVNIFYVLKVISNS